ncbi:MAG: hypothetical protein LM632_05185 [Armatimonadetes bacterium]|nr:hypothetical protein [Armatimonadota bacterium]
MTKRELVIQKQKIDSAPETQDQTTLALSCPSPPPATAGLTSSVFPPNFTPIFPLRQNLVSLTFNVTRLQLRNPRVWKRLQRIFAMLAKERKEAKEVLWEFLGFDDDDGDEVEICAKVLLMQRWFEERFAYFCEKPPPNTASNAWLSAVVPRLRRAPSSAALRCVGGCVFFHAA